MYEIRKKYTGMAVAVLSAAAMLLILFSNVSSAELHSTIPEGSTDLGNLYGYEIQFIYSPPSGSDVADTVEWEFGDGSSTTGKIVSHRYSEIGDYLVKQTATNTIGSSVAYYIVHIRGYPAVTYDLGYDGNVILQNQTQFKVAAQLADPVREGYTFDGWYTDAELTTKYTGYSISVPTTLYAKWSAAGTDPVPQESSSTEWVPLALAVVGILGILLFVATKNPVILLLAAISLAVCAAIYSGVI